MMVSETEYSELRAELRDWDSTCVRVLALLGTLWTAVYGFSELRAQSFVLIVLSILWIIGLLYIVDKRFQIRKISLYLDTQVEDERSGLYWESWQRENSASTERAYGLRRVKSKNIKFLRFSPVEMEILLTLFVVVSNTLYLYWITYFNWANHDAFDEAVRTIGNMSANAGDTAEAIVVIDAVANSSTTVEWDVGLSMLSTIIAVLFLFLCRRICEVYRRTRHEHQDEPSGQDDKQSQEAE